MASFDDFKTARRWNGFNRFLQVVLAISLVLSLNFLASQSSVHRRWDILQGGRQPLALETQKQLEAMARRAPQETNTKEPWVRIYSTLSEVGWTHDEQVSNIKMLRGQLEPLLDDFLYTARRTPPRGWLSVERVDRMKNAGVWAELVTSHHGISATTALVVVCKKRYKIINIEDVFRVNKSGELDAFKGEEALISALLNVTNEKPQVVYHTVGHGEMSPADTGEDGLSAFATHLQARNTVLLPLDLTKVNEVPTDASMVLLPAPVTIFSPAEAEKLGRYMRERNGRMLAFVNLENNDERLERLFFDWGILADKALAVDNSKESLDVKGNMLVRVDGRGHELTRLLAGRGVLAVRRPRAVRFDQGSYPDKTLKVTELVFTKGDASQSWGERNYQRPRPYVYNPEQGDIPAPVSVAAVAERAAGLSMNLKFPGGRMLVAGSGSIVGNSLLNDANDNAFFLLNTVNWMLDRDQSLNIPPRPLPEYMLRATRPDLNDVAWLFTLLPGGVLLLGGFVFFWRRNT